VESDGAEESRLEVSHTSLSASATRRRSRRFTPANTELSATHYQHTS